MVLRGVALMTLVNVTKAGLALALSILIARLVPPSDYGLVALAITLLTLLMLLTDLGLASAIVRQPQLDEAQAGAALGLLGLGALLSAAVLALSAGLLEQALAMPGLARVLQGFALVCVSSIVAVVPRALLERRLAYVPIAIVEVGAMVLGFAAFAVAARAGAGILSLVAFHVVLQGLRMLGFLAITHRRFRLNLRPRGLGELVQVGGSVFVSNLLSFGARNVDRLLIAAVLGSASLGLYAFAYQFMTLPLVLLTWPASGVLLAVLSRLQEEREVGAALARSVMVLTATLTFPLMGLMAFALELPIRAFFGPRWADASALIAILAPAGALQSLASYAGALLISRKQTRLNMRLALFNCSFISLCFVASVWAGIEVMTISYSLSMSLVSVIFVGVSLRSFGISPRELPCLLAAPTLGTLLGIGVAIAVFGIRLDHWPQWLGAMSLFIIIQLLALGLNRARLRQSITDMRRVSSALKVLRDPAAPRQA